MEHTSTPPPAPLLDLASATDLIKRLVEVTVELEKRGDTQTPAEFGWLADEALELLEREVVEPIDLRMVPGPCHREILERLEGIGKAVEGLSLIAAQAVANGSPIVNAILDSGTGSPSRHASTFAEVYTAEDVAEARERGSALDWRKAAELRDVCLARGVDPLRASIRLERTIEGRTILVVDGEPALEDDGGSF